MKLFVAILIITTFKINSFSQIEKESSISSLILKDTTKFETKYSNSFRKKMIFPGTLLLSGISVSQQKTKETIQKSVLLAFDGFKTTVDDFLPFVPVATMYTLDLLKVKTENSLWDHTKYLAVSQFASFGLVMGLKNLLLVERPDKSNFFSMPSGHTTIAFVSSQVLFHEFYNTNKFIAFSGFITSILTAGLRVVNNEHWLPDVLIGAGIGVLTTNLVYYFKPFLKWNPWKKVKSPLILNILNKQRL